MNNGIKKGVFISFFSKDKDLLTELEDRFTDSLSLYPIIITTRREAGNSNVGKVIKGIEEGEIFLPIITKNSITQQWINQEIGYAKAINKPIFPLIEKIVFKKLKGFIHKEDDQPYIFNQHEFPSFCQCIGNAIEDIEKRFYISLENLSNKEKDYINTGRMYVIKGMGMGAFLKVHDVIHPIDSNEAVLFIKSFTKQMMSYLDPQTKKYKIGMPIKLK